MKRLPIAVMVPTLIIGIMALYMSLPVFFISLKKPVDFNELSESELRKGLHVEGDVWAVLDTFATEQTWTENSNGSRTPAKTSGYYYIIPAGEESYIGIEGSTGNRSDFMKVDEATYDFLTGVTDSIDPTVYYHYEGYMDTMEDELYDLFIDWFVDMEYFGTTNEAMIQPYCPALIIRPMPPGLYILLGIGLAMLALNLLFVALHMGYKKKAKAAKAAAAGADEPWAPPSSAAPDAGYSAPTPPPSAPASGDPWDAPGKQ